MPRRRNSFEPRGVDTERRGALYLADALSLRPVWVRDASGTLLTTVERTGSAGSGGKGGRECRGRIMGRGRRGSLSRAGGDYVQQAGRHRGYAVVHAVAMEGPIPRPMRPAKRFNRGADFGARSATGPFCRAANHPPMRTPSTSRPSPAGNDAPSAFLAAREPGAAAGPRRWPTSTRYWRGCSGELEPPWSGRSACQIWRANTSGSDVGSLHTRCSHT